MSFIGYKILGVLGKPGDLYFSYKILDTDFNHANIATTKMVDEAILEIYDYHHLDVARNLILSYKGIPIEIVRINLQKLKIMSKKYLKYEKDIEKYLILI